MKTSQGLPSLLGLPSRALARLARVALGVCIVISAIVTLVLGALVFRPAHQDLATFRDGATKALFDRNRELIRSAIEQSAGDMLRLLGAAEDAVQKIAGTLSRTTTLSNNGSTLPLDREFFPGGKLTNLLQTHQGYEAPVSFEVPQIKLGQKSETDALSLLWKRFLGATKALHAHHPELKWLYLGTEGGSFLVFPSSPQIPSDYDPRKRDWYREAMRTDRLIWTSPYFTAGGNDLVLTAAMRVQSSVLRKSVVVGVDVVMADVVTKILSAPYCDRCVFYLVSSDGKLLGKKGDPVLGPSWTEPPKARFLAEEIASSSPGIDASKLAQSVLAGIGAGPADDFKHVSRAPQADWVDSNESQIDYISVPIANTHWRLVGAAPKNYTGQDGERILASITGFADHYRWAMTLMALAWIGFSAFLIFILLRMARAALKDALKPTITQFSTLAAQLEQLHFDQSNASSPLETEPSLTREHALVVGAVARMRQRLVSEAMAKEEFSVRAKLGEHARQVAHNMRSPLKALEMIVPSLAGASQTQTRVLRSVITEIRDLANSLNSDRFGEVAPSVDSAQTGLIRPSGKRDTVLLSTLLESIVSERRIAMRDRNEVEIEAAFDRSAYGLFVNVEPTDLRCVISNLINNGVEAIGDGRGRVQLRLFRQEERAMIEISDSGAGMSREILDKIRSRGGTYGKPGGSGIGLRHARAAVEGWEGRMDISSSEATGTQVLVALPAASPPEWFLPCLELTTAEVVYVVDDDESLRQLWTYRLRKGSGARLEVKSFGDLDAFKRAFRAERQSGRPYRVLMDYEFKGQPQTGLDAIDELEIAEQSVLVTAHSDDDSVVARARFIGVQVLPKTVMEWLPIEINESRLDLANREVDASPLS
jgi:signal transduction histidine kinase